MSTTDHVNEVSAHFDGIAAEYDMWKEKNAYYYQNIISFLKKNIPAGSSVLEIGCATGAILNSVEPATGVGLDISERMVEIARKKYPSYRFEAVPAEDFECEEKFDYIIMVDLLDHVHDIAEMFRSVHKFCKPTTRIIATTINPWWSPILDLMEKLKAKMPEGPHNFVERRNLSKMMEFLDFSINYTGYLLLFPKYIPLLSFLANTIGTRAWPINKFSAVHYMVLKPLPENRTDLGLGCSVVIPCYNEEGNIAEAVKRVPKMGVGTEIIVVSDGSTDRTADIVRDMQKDMPNLRLIDYSPNQGKGYAVKQGFDAATREVVMVLDADMTVRPEALPEFFDPLNKGLCEFTNGTRMVYPMENQSMRFLNLIGNKVFGLVMTFLTGQNITDTLCGTKALYREDYKCIEMGRDKWGDFDLLFGAAASGSKIIEIPVHYMARKADLSKMKTLSHGLHLAKVCVRGFKELVLGL